MVRERGNILTFSFTVIAVVFAVLFAYSLVCANDEELEQIKGAIAAKGAKWHADETSVSKLSPHEKKMRLGSNELENTDSRNPGETAPAPLVTAAPPTFDWRNVNGVSFVTPVKNQGSCGSCWAFAVTAALESQMMIATGGQPIDLSEQILLSCSGAGTCSGGYTSSASNFIRDVGLPLESCFPYTATDNSCINACSNWKDDIHRVVGWNSATINTIKSALYTYGPVVAHMYVYNDFYSYRSGVYSYAAGSYVGAHAVLVVGYDDALQAFIVKNSWGSGWGEAGYFMIAYTEATGTSRFGYSLTAYEGYGDNPTPPPPAPATCSYALSASSKRFKAAGGNGSVGVSTQDNCSWSVANGSTWVNVASGMTDLGSATVSYTVQPNPSPTRRTVGLNIAGIVYTVIQEGLKNAQNIK